MTHQQTDTHINNSVFEGPEKLLEVWFARDAEDVPDATSAIDGKSGLRKISRSIWEDMLDVVKCKVISVIEGTETDAYLLSESSLFISPHRIILKTCGTTLNLLGLPRILEIAREQASLHSVYRCFYSRKAFMFPERQLGPHRNWKDEVEFLDNIFPNGAAYTVGKVNGDHWLLYLTSPSENDAPLPATNMHTNGHVDEHHCIDEGFPPKPHCSCSPMQDYTIEILMSDLSSECCEPFRSTPSLDVPISPSGHAQRLSSTLGISHIFPPYLTTLDAYSFSPCGYSANALIQWDDSMGTRTDREVNLHSGRPGREGYYTIHVTPEAGSSYASFECNVPLPTSARSFPHSPSSCVSGSERYIPDLRMLIQRVVIIFQPRRLTLTLFISSDEDGGGDVEPDVCDNAAEAAQRALKSALGAVPVVGVEGTTNLYYKRTDKINYELGGYDLAFASFELL